MCVVNGSGWEHKRRMISDGMAEVKIAKLRRKTLAEAVQLQAERQSAEQSEQCSAEANVKNNEQFVSFDAVQ